MAVVGTSGCGKSSLVRAGLLPALLGGYAVGTGSSWQIADLQPGGDPLGNLARALNGSGAAGSLDATALRSASAAVVQAVAQARTSGLLAPDANVLILVDQFEELFRYEARRESATADRDEKARFIALLLEAARAERIFVVLTLRAEFLGDCSQFRDLPEAINRGQYLVPRMTRLQRRAAIEGPVRVAGARIAPHLVQRLLNDLGGDPDQLPVLQNALMRIWGNWANQKKPEKEIQFEHYAAIGTAPEGTTTLKAALDRHAEEALAEAKQRLGPAGESLVKGIFLRLRGRDDKGRETRIPASIEDLCDVTGADLDSVRTAVDCFRDDKMGRTFLTPFKSKVEKVGMADKIDLTHESLLRCWSRLKDQWVPEEEESKRIYVDLVRRAEAEGASQNLLQGSLLERVFEWWQKRQPNAAWADRYAPGFGAAKEYLFASHKKYRYRYVRLSITWLAPLLAVGLLVVLLSLGEARDALRKAREARQEAVVHLLASKAALAVTEDGSGPATGLLLATESLKRSPTPEAQAVAIRALSLLPPPLRSLPAPRSRQVAFGAKGTLLAFLEPDGAVRIWDPLGKRLKTPAALLTGIESFAFSRHAEFLVGSTESGSLVIMDAAAGKEVARFGCPGTRPALAISSSGLVVAALCAGEIRIWKAGSSWAEARAVPVHASKVEWSQLALDDKGDVLALGRFISEDSFSFLTLLPLASGQEIGRLIMRERISAMTFLPSPFGEISLAFGGESGNVRIWSHATSSTEQAQREVRIVFRRSVAVTALSRDAAEKKLIAGYQDGVARVWDLDQDREVARLIGSGSLLSVELSDAAQQAFAVGRDLSLQAWDLRRQDDSVLLGNRIFGLGAVGLFTDIPLLLYQDGLSFEILDLRQRVVLGKWPWRGKNDFPVAIAPNGKSVALLKVDAPFRFRLSLADFSTHRIGAPLWPPVPVRGDLRLLVFSPDGQHLAGFARWPFSPRPGLFVWSAANGRQEIYRSAEEPDDIGIPPFCFTPDSRQIFIVSKDGRLRGFSLAAAGQDEKDLSIAPERGVTALAFSPDGSLLVTAASEARSDLGDGGPIRARIRVRSFPAGREITSFEQASPIHRLAFSQDARYLLTAASDSSVSVWSLEKAQQEAKFLSDEPARAITFTRDGKVAVVRSNSLTFHIWTPADLIAEACRRVRRNLTPDEWNMPREDYSKTCPGLP